MFSCIVLYCDMLARAGCINPVYIFMFTSWINFYIYLSSHYNCIYAPLSNELTQWHTETRVLNFLVLANGEDFLRSQVAYLWPQSIKCAIDPVAIKTIYLCSLIIFNRKDVDVLINL